MFSLDWLGPVAKLLNTTVEKVFPSAKEWKEKDKIHSIKQARLLRKRIRKWLKKSKEDA